jgi:hypothetical protein
MSHGAPSDIGFAALVPRCNHKFEYRQVWHARVAEPYVSALDEASGS